MASFRLKSNDYQTRWELNIGNQPSSGYLPLKVPVWYSDIKLWGEMMYQPIARICVLFSLLLLSPALVLADNYLYCVPEAHGAMNEFKFSPYNAVDPSKRIEKFSISDFEIKNDESFTFTSKDNFKAPNSEWTRLPFGNFGGIENFKCSYLKKQGLICEQDKRRRITFTDVKSSERFTRPGGKHYLYTYVYFVGGFGIEFTGGSCKLTSRG